MKLNLTVEFMPLSLFVILDIKLMFRMSAEALIFGDLLNSLFLNVATFLNVVMRCASVIGPLLC